MKNQLKDSPALTTKVGHLIRIALLDLLILASLYFLKPLYVLGGAVALIILFLGTLADAGFVALISLVSHISSIDGIDFDLLRGIKWLSVGSIALVTAIKIAQGHLRTKYEFDFVAKYFLFYLGWGIVCSLFAINPFASLLWVVSKGLFFVVYLLAVITVTDKKSALLILGILVLDVLVSGLYSSSGLLSGQYHRFRGFHDNANGYGAFLSVVLPLLAACLIAYRNRTLRAFLAMSLMIGLIALAFSWSRSAWVAATVATFAFLILEKRTKLIATLVLGVVVAVLIIATSSSAFSLFYSVSRLQAGTTHRTTLWSTASETIIDNPVFGVGYGAKVSDLMGDARNIDAGKAYFLQDKNIAFNSHNYFLATAVATGIPGTVIFIAFLFAALKSELRKRREADQRYRPLHSAMIAILCAAFPACFFDSGLIMSSGSNANYFWIVLGLITAISRRKLLD